MTYLFCAILGLGVLAAICIPLFGKGETMDSTVLDETEWDLLQRKKEVILGNVQDLDFEHKCGKLSDIDHQNIRAELMAEAAQVLEKIDALESSLDVDTLIRREVDSRRGLPRPLKSGKDCPTCGSKNPLFNKFCAECGANLNR